VCVCVCVCVRARARACVHSVHTRVDTDALQVHERRMDTAWSVTECNRAHVVTPRSVESGAAAPYLRRFVRRSSTERMRMKPTSFRSFKTILRKMPLNVSSDHFLRSNRASGGRC